MNIRQAVHDAVRLASKGWGYTAGCHMHKVFVMSTATRINFWGDTVGIWSVL